jgi:short-subunit dehydrogenase
VTKAGMISLSETLYGELKPYNIGVTAVCPAFFATNIITSGRFQSEEQRIAAAKLMSGSRETAQNVARKIIRAVEQRQLYVFAPWIAGVFWRLKRLMPRVTLNLIASRNARESEAARRKSGS